MVFAEEIRKEILQIAAKRGPSRPFNAAEVARSVDPENWQGLVEQVRLVAATLVKEGKIAVREAGTFNEMFSLRSLPEKPN